MTVHVTVLQDEEIFATLNPGGEPYVWKIVEGKPQEIEWYKLPNGDYQLKLHTKGPKVLRVVFEGESTIPDHQWYHIGIKGDPESKSMITTNREGAQWLQDTFGENS